MATKEKRRESFVEFVGEYFGSVASRTTLCSGCEILKVAPEGLPQSYISCGLSFLTCQKQGPFELMFSTSCGFQGQGQTALENELERLGAMLEKEEKLPNVVALSDSMQLFGYTHAMLWPVGQCPTEEGAVTVFVLIPLWEQEAQWIGQNGTEGFALAYHAQVSEEAFFNLDVKRSVVDPENSDRMPSCELSL